MSIDYENTILNLMKSLPFVISVVIIEDNKHLVYSTPNWDVQLEIDDTLLKWTSLKLQSIVLSGIKYQMRQCTDDRFIATSLKGHGHIIGVKDDKMIILAHIEPDGVIPFTTMELARMLASLTPKRSYLEMDIQLGKEIKANQDTLIKEISRKEGKRTEKNEEMQDQTSKVPFTARLMAHYRAQEINRLIPLIIDPFAERLAGDLNSYFKEHIRYSEMDYPIVRSYFIENQLLEPWCNRNKNSQIILLGAGLDTRAYRFLPLQTNEHALFEVDFPEIIDYKEQVLGMEKPLCKLKRISADLSASKWTVKLIESGYSKDIPTFWILEGLVYYIDLERVISLLKELKTLSNNQSGIFLDIMQRSRWFESSESLFSGTTDSFTKHFKWGLDIRQVPQFFIDLGWEVSCCFADDHDQGRNVGQKAMIFIHGVLNRI